MFEPIFLFFFIYYYYYYNNPTTSATQEETTQRKVIIKNLPTRFYKNTVPQCDQTSCLKIGESILLNQLLQSTSAVISIIIKDKLNSEEAAGIEQIYGEETISTEETSKSPYYLLFNNTYGNIYRYINLYTNKCILASNGFISGNKLIELVGCKCIINGTTYYCDLTYYINNDYILLCDDSAIPVGIISSDDFIECYSDC